MQTKAIIAALLCAAIGTHAAPAAEVLDSRVASIPIRIYDSAGCNNGPPATTWSLNTDGTCQGVAPILTADTDSALVPTGSLPPGCSIKIYSDNTCSSVNVITITSAAQCFTFGRGQFIFSGKTVGTC